MKAVVALSLLIVASPLTAGPWVDDLGRSAEMQFPGASQIALKPNNHFARDFVSAFYKLCIKTNFDRSAVGTAVKLLDWGFTYQPEMMPFKDPVDVGGWNSPDATLRMANGIFFNKKPQCSLTFMAADGPDMATIAAAISTDLGAAPSNAAKQFDKKGKPKKYYAPEWTAMGVDGAKLKVFALPSTYNSGAFQLAVLKN